MVNYFNRGDQLILFNTKPVTLVLYQPVKIKHLSVF